MEQFPIESLTTQEILWLRFSQNRARHPQSSLLIGAAHNNLDCFANRMARTLLCNSSNSPCEQCQSCRLALTNEHPDIVKMHPDKTGGMIKIDQIREIQQSIFTTAQLGDYRVVIIDPADRMNIAAANALLKILEEPPAHIYFLLIAEQLSTVLPTIVSRCQQWRFSDGGHSVFDTLNYYDPQSMRGEIIAKQEDILRDMQLLQSGAVSACALASKWSKFPFDELVWFLYLMISQLIEQRLGCGNINQSSMIQSIALHTNPVHLFALLDKLHGLIKTLNYGTSVNQLLTLEELLHGFYQSTEYSS